MSDNEQPAGLSELEAEFINELKGEGSLSVFITGPDANTYVGWDVHSEDIAALYFEGIGIPRWESLKADTVEEQTALYWERFNERMDKFPLIGRARDTDETVEYSTEEIPQVLEECQRVTDATTDQKAIRALQKISLAAAKASEQKSGLRLTPSQSQVF